MVTSLENISEFIRVLKDFKIRMDDELIYEWVTLIIKNSIIADIKNKIKVVKEDPSDDKFIETAINGKADYIVTQDRHLLNIEEFENIKIITPEEFLKIIEYRDKLRNRY